VKISRGMGAISKGKLRAIKKRDGNQPVALLSSGGKPGLYANIHAKRMRIAAGSGEKMRKPGVAGAPTAKAFRQSKKTVKKLKEGGIGSWIKELVGGEVDPRVAKAQKAESDLRNYTIKLMSMDREKIPPLEVQDAQRRALYKAMIEAAPLGYKPGILPGRSYGFKTPKEWEGIEQSRKTGGLIRRKK